MEKYAAPSDHDNVCGGEPTLDDLLMELCRLKEKTARLSMLNELHGRLAGAVDLPSMIDAFSVWLMSRVPHELMAFDAPKGGRRHICCSCHGPDRQQVVGLVDRFFGDAGRLHLLRKWKDGDFFIHNWPLAFDGIGGIIMVMRHDQRLTAMEEQVVAEALDVLTEALQRAMAYEDVFQQAKSDALTGLANRRVFDERITPLIDCARRYGHPLTLISMDLDHFKQINDTLGHTTGDEVLKRVARLFTSMIRPSDLLIRMGGDEFVLLLPGTTQNSAAVLAERICHAVEELAFYSAPDQKLGISIGVSQWQDGMTEDGWLEKVDALLYQAKGQGRNQVCVDSGAD